MNKKGKNGRSTNLGREFLDSFTARGIQMGMNFRLQFAELAKLAFLSCNIQTTDQKKMILHTTYKGALGHIFFLL